MVTIKSVARINPLAPSEDPRFYARAISNGTLDLNKLSEFLADGSTLRRNDVYAVLIGAVDIMIREIKDGNRISFGELGTFYLSVSSTGVENESDFQVSQITGNRIKYLPSITLKNAMKNVRYRLVKK